MKKTIKFTIMSIVLLILITTTHSALSNSITESKNYKTTPAGELDGFYLLNGIVKIYTIVTEEGEIMVIQPIFLRAIEGNTQRWRLFGPLTDPFREDKSVWLRGPYIMERNSPILGLKLYFLSGSVVI